MPIPTNSYSTAPQNSYGAYSTGGNGAKTLEIPKKYIKIHGVTQLNPAYEAYQKGQGKIATTVLNPGKTLAVVSNMDQLQQLRKDVGDDRALAKSTDAVIEMMQDQEICQKVGLSADAMVDSLGKKFAKYEAPMGLMNKLMVLSEYDELEFLIDDSGSMNQNSDTRDGYGRIQTRWNEVEGRLYEMLEILAHVPTPTMKVCFFNRRNVVTLQRNGETPEIFIQNAYRQLTNVFARMPEGSTPAKERLEESFNQGRGKRVARYFFCDGEPDGGQAAKEAITYMVKNRQNPEGNPLTFLSCTNEDEQVKWMKEAEEVAPYCSEYDDFEDEAREVQQDQGVVFPFTKGFHLIGQLVGAMNPDDLDALDESVPLTKWTLDNLLGVQTTLEDYRYYFNGFTDAQRKRRIDDQLDRIKSQQNWEPYFNEFATQPVAKNIEAVKRFKQVLAGEAGDLSNQSWPFNLFQSWFKG